MSDENKVLDSYLKSQLAGMLKATKTLAEAMRSYYDALIKAGFNDQQAIELCKEFYYILFQRNK